VKIEYGSIKRRYCMKIAKYSLAVMAIGVFAFMSCGDKSTSVGLPASVTTISQDSATQSAALAVEGLDLVNLQTLSLDITSPWVLAPVGVSPLEAKSIGPKAMGSVEPGQMGSTRDEIITILVAPMILAQYFLDTARGCATITVPTTCPDLDKFTDGSCTISIEFPAAGCTISGDNVKYLVTGKITLDAKIASGSGSLAVTSTDLKMVNNTTSKWSKLGGKVTISGSKGASNFVRTMELTGMRLDTDDGSWATVDGKDIMTVIPKTSLKEQLTGTVKYKKAGASEVSWVMSREDNITKNADGTYTIKIGDSLTKDGAKTWRDQDFTVAITKTDTTSKLPTEAKLNGTSNITYPDGGKLTVIAENLLLADCDKGPIGGSIEISNGLVKAKIAFNGCSCTVNIFLAGSTTGIPTDICKASGQ
jgi:hypothetical protein